MIKRHKNQKQSGFTLVELMVVVIIILVVSAFAIPRVQLAIANLRLRATGTNINGLLQQLRMQAVRDNRAYTMRTAPAVGANALVTVYIDSNANGAFDAGEPSVALPTDTVISDGVGGPAALPAMAPAITFPAWNKSANNNLTISFNERGLPCINMPACQTITPFFVYLQQARPLGTPGWAALTITQAGRIKTYTYQQGAANPWY
jgi:prepilin-type N-terminal cleavage/methylation domain-containing protein